MALTRTAPNTFLPVAQGGTTVKQGIINDDTDIKYILSILSGLSTGKIPYRQTVLTGAVGSDGQPSFLVPSGLYVSISAATKSLLLSFAAGYGTDGYPVDYLSAVTADVANAWNLPPTQTVYLYIDRDASTGTLTYGYTTIEPSYATTKPTTPGTGQAWYNPVLQYMQVYNGSSWDIRQRLYVAKGVTTDAATTLTYTLATHDLAVSSLSEAIDAVSAQYTELKSYSWTEKFIMYAPYNGFVTPPLELTRNAQGKEFRFRTQGAPTSSATVYLFTGKSIALNASLTNSETTMALNTAITFSGTPYALIDANGTPEVVQMTAGSGTTSITIVRAKLGTMAAAHNNGGAILEKNFGNIVISTNAPGSLATTSLTPAQKDLFAYAVSGDGLSSCNVTVIQEWGNR